MRPDESARRTFDQYLRDVNRIPLLTVDEERDLARRLRAGDLRAGHRLVQANLRFVVKVVFEYRSYGMDLPDLVQEGNVGLMKAVQKFDPDRRVRLISYAVWWIRAYVQNHIRRSWSLVKIGTTQAQRRLFFSLARTRHELERLEPGASLQVGIDPEVLAKVLRVRRADVVEMTQRMDGRDVSLDEPINGESAATHLDNTPALGDRQDVALEVREEERRVRTRVEAALAALDPRERHIVEVRLMGEDADTLGELGHHFGFSRERARQLELRAREKLKRDLEPLAREIGLPRATEPGNDAARRDRRRGALPASGPVASVRELPGAAAPRRAGGSEPARPHAPLRARPVFTTSSRWATRSGPTPTPERLGDADQ